MAGLAVVSVTGTKVEVRVGGAWVQLPGVSSWAESGGDAPTNDVIAFEAIATVTGRPRPQQIDLETVSYTPLHPGWKEVRKASRGSTPLQVRLTTPKLTFFSGAADTLCAIANTGVCTFSGDGSNADFTGDQYAPGMAIEIGGTPYTIVSITDAGVVTVDHKAAVAAATYNVIIPSMRRGNDGFTANVTVADRASLRADGEMVTAVSFAAISALPEFVAAD